MARAAHFSTRLVRSASSHATSLSIVVLSATGEVEYCITHVTTARAESLVRRARNLVELAVQIVRLGRQ
jgi:hypothetical protein